jgi:hypothetical protein
MDHIGIEVHKKDSQICILTEQGDCSSAGSGRSQAGSARSWAPGRGRGSSSSPREKASGLRAVPRDAGALG